MEAFLVKRASDGGGGSSKKKAKAATVSPVNPVMAILLAVWIHLTTMRVLASLTVLLKKSQRSD